MRVVDELGGEGFGCRVCMAVRRPAWEQLGDGVVFASLGELELHQAEHARLLASIAR